MAPNEATIRNLDKEKSIKLALKYQSMFDSTLITISNIKTGLPKLKKYYEKLDSDLIVTKQGNMKLCNKMKFLERQCWTNEQYSKRQSLEISDVSESVPDKDLERKVLNLFEKIDIEIYPENIEACHWVKI